MTELVRLKGENAKLEVGNERLTSELFQWDEGRRDDSSRRKKESAGHRAVKQHSATTRNVSSGTENHGVPDSRVELEPAPCRWNCGSSTPACGGGTKRGLTTIGEALGRSKGGFSTKIHLRAEGGGKPIALLITAGQWHEQSVFETHIEAGAIKRAGRGRPRIRPERVVGDKGYSSRKIRWYLRKRGIRAVIAHHKSEQKSGCFDKASYRKRNVVERLVNRLKQFRRIPTRYEKLAVNYVGMLTIAAIVLWMLV